MNNKIHDKAHTTIQKESTKRDTKRRITQPKLIQKNKTKNCPEYVPHYTVRHKKLHHFVFAITLSYLSLFKYLLVHIYRDKFGTN